MFREFTQENVSPQIGWKLVNGPFPAGCVSYPSFCQLLLLRPVTDNDYVFYIILPVGVKFQHDLIVYHEYIFMLRNTDLTYLKCFKERMCGPKSFPELQSWPFSHLLNIFLWWLNSTCLGPHSLRFLLCPSLPSLENTSYISILLSILCHLDISYWLHRLNLNCHHFLSPLLTPPSHSEIIDFLPFLAIPWFYYPTHNL